MSERDDPVTAPAARRALLALLLGALLLLCAAVMRPFIVPILWAAILAYTSWPAHRRIRRLCRGREVLAAALMTVIVVVILVVPLAWLALLLQDEAAAAVRAARAYTAGDLPALPGFLRAIPWLGDALQQALDRYGADPPTIRRLLLDWAQGSRAELLGVVGDVGRNLAKLLLAIVTLFFLYRDGAGLVAQATRVAARFFDHRLDRYVHAAAAMTRAVIYGLLLTALAQGTVAGVGYAIVGLDAPVLLGALTAAASIVPVVGTLLVMAPASLALFATGHLWPALGLIAWGTLLVHPVDNVLRPLLISNATKLPFLLVMFGVLGGLAAFGLIGVFIGPIALALAVAVWREWLEERRAAAPPSG